MAKSVLLYEQGLGKSICPLGKGLKQALKALDPSLTLQLAIKQVELRT